MAAHYYTVTWDQLHRDADLELKDAFRRLLDCPDPLIYDYVLGRASPPDAALKSLIRRMTAIMDLRFDE